MAALCQQTPNVPLTAPQSQAQTFITYTQFTISQLCAFEYMQEAVIREGQNYIPQS